MQIYISVDTTIVSNTPYKVLCIIMRSHLLLFHFVCTYLRTFFCLTNLFNHYSVYFIVTQPNPLLFLHFLATLRRLVLPSLRLRLLREFVSVVFDRSQKRYTVTTYGGVGKPTDNAATNTNSVHPPLPTHQPNERSKNFTAPHNTTKGDQDSKFDIFKGLGNTHQYRATKDHCTDK